MVTDGQVRRLLRELDSGTSLATAARRADRTDKTARHYRKTRTLPGTRKRSRGPRTYRTRPDPFAAVWPTVEARRKAEPRLRAKTLFDWLRREHPGEFLESHRRTFERRVRPWRASHGPGKSILFRQVHDAGDLAASDFTHMNSLAITIAGQRFDHMVYHFVLTYSNGESATLVNNLSVAREFQTRYRDLLTHDGLSGQRINARQAHENGDAESSHGHFKTAVDQALLLRGSRDFASREEYASFLQQVVATRNDAFLARRENVLVFGKPGCGKTHAIAAVAEQLVLRGHPVLFATCSLLVQDLLAAKRDRKLERALKRLAGFAAIVIDDLGYGQQSREEMEVLFTLLAERYERGSVMLTSNLPFSQWTAIFKDPMTTAAAIDRLVHHSVIVELNVPSDRLETAKHAKPPTQPEPAATQ